MVEHYFSETQTSEFKPKKIRISVAGIEFPIYTAGGVFSPSQLDKGTKLLIESVMIEDNWKVLDFGCGYGVLGIALKKKNPSLSLVMSDVNTRAVELSKINMELNSIEAEVIHSDIFKNEHLDNMRFNTIILNPPQTAGKEVCFKMIEESKAHLLDGGLFQLVARYAKGGETLGNKMEEVFGNVRGITRKAGFKVYVSEKT